jgi:adenylate cyclase
MMPRASSVLIVDDSEENRDLIGRHLQRLGLEVTMVGDGSTALALVERRAFDLIMLDIMMPGLNGYEVLRQLKSHVEWRVIPVIMVSAVDDLEGVVKCIEMGAEDYVFKPFKPILLKARVNASLEKKRLRDQEAAILQALQTEQAKSERLLLNILPEPIARRLKQSSGIIADTFPEATVLFADIVDFTQLSARTSPAALVSLLNEVFSAFDELAERRGLEKIKTIGDAYMLVSGVPTPRADHAEAVAEMALAMQAVMPRFSPGAGGRLRLRIGLHSGPVTAGVIGVRKFAYDVWGDTVNIASRMEALGAPDRIQVTQAVYQRLTRAYHFEPRGPVTVKGKGEMTTYWLTASQPAESPRAEPLAAGAG